MVIHCPSQCELVLGHVYRVLGKAKAKAMQAECEVRTEDSPFECVCAEVLLDMLPPEAFEP